MERKVGAEGERDRAQEEGKRGRRKQGASQQADRAICDPTSSKLGAHPAITLTDSDQPSHCTVPSSLELSCASVSWSAGKPSAPGKLGQSTPCGPGGMTGQSV